MIFNFFKKTETREREASRQEVFSEIARAKKNKDTMVHIDAQISMELYNELSVMGYSVYSTPGFSGTNIYWKNQ